ncbi:MAG: ParB/RepB/Spo0J family partition protein [Deltaproteobacteria bacterium]|nr:ParB/RepB/Spo0J family partition protein [Deltaproteobacteria bacterium]
MPAVPTATVAALVPLDRIRRNPEQPREPFDEADLAGLAASIRTHGILQPILLRQEGEAYVIVAGERRWRAAGMAGLTEIPAVITDQARQARDALLLALVENLQRRDLDCVEEAHGYERLVRTFGLTQEGVAARVGKDRATVANRIRLLNLPDRTLEALRAGRITAGHGKALLALADPTRIAQVQALVEARGLSVRATERLVDEWNRMPRTRPPPVSRFDPAERLLARHLGAPVSIRPGARGGGRIVIRYGSEEELTALVERLRGP